MFYVSCFFYSVCMILEKLVIIIHHRNGNEKKATRKTLFDMFVQHIHVHEIER